MKEKKKKVLRWIPRNLRRSVLRSKTTPKEDTKEKKGIKLPPPEDLNILDDIIEKDMNKKKEKDTAVKEEDDASRDYAQGSCEKEKVEEKTKTPKKNKFLGDPWDQLSSWNEKMMFVQIRTRYLTCTSARRVPERSSLTDVPQCMKLSMFLQQSMLEVRQAEFLVRIRMERESCGWVDRSPCPRRFSRLARFSYVVRLQ